MSSDLELAHFVSNTKHEDLPDNVIKATKRDILDTIGVGLGGSRSPGIGEVVDYAKEMGGRESSTILAYGYKVPPAIAALANGSMCHALDFDDTHDRAIIHAGAVVVPAAIALAEYIGKVNGREFINAVTLGIEIHCRLGLATKYIIGWALPSLYGYFGAATVAGKLLGLDEEGILNAWGIAYAQAAGNLEMIASGGLTKRLQLGFAASGGILAALLAKKGISGSKENFEGKSGIFNLYQRGEYDRASLTQDLYKRYEVVNLSFKPYPSCRFNHTGIDAALDIINKYDIKPEQIENIKVGMSSYGYAYQCEPLDVKRKPRNVVDAQFSIPYLVACALVRKKVDVNDLSDESIKDPLVLEVASKVYPFVDSRIDKKAGKRIAPARVEVQIKGGDIISFEAQIPKGDPVNPMSNDELAAKFRACAISGVNRSSANKVNDLIDALNNLEEVEDITEIVDLLHLYD